MQNLPFTASVSQINPIIVNYIKHKVLQWIETGNFSSEAAELFCLQPYHIIITADLPVHNNTNNHAFQRSHQMNYINKAINVDQLV